MKELLTGFIHLAPLGILVASSLRADVEVAVASLQSTGSRTVVQFTMKNTFTQPIRDARAWVFLLDAEGKVVGNKAQWVVGGGVPEAGVALPAEGSQQYAVSVETPKPAVSAQVTFSRIVLADGSTADPQRVVKTASGIKSPSPAP